MPAAEILGFIIHTGESEVRINRFCFAIIASAMPLVTGGQTVDPKINTIDYSIIRSIGAVCGAGLSMDAKGEVDAKISRIFGGSVTGAGETRIDIGQAKELLSQFSENEAKQSIYKAYVTCVIQAINSISNMSKETSAPPVIDNLLIPDPLIIIKDGQRFAMKAKESRAIGRSSMIFSVLKIRSDDLLFGYVDAENNKSVRAWAKQAEQIVFADGCSVVPYFIDATQGAEKVSFYTRCK